MTIVTLITLNRSMFFIELYACSFALNVRCVKCPTTITTWLNDEILLRDRCVWKKRMNRSTHQIEQIVSHTYKTISKNECIRVKMTIHICWLNKRRKTILSLSRSPSTHTHTCTHSANEAPGKFIGYTVFFLLCIQSNAMGYRKEEPTNRHLQSTYYEWDTIRSNQWHMSTTGIEWRTVKQEKKAYPRICIRKKRWIIVTGIKTSKIGLISYFKKCHDDRRLAKQSCQGRHIFNLYVWV